MSRQKITVTEYHDSEKRFLNVYFKGVRDKDECPLNAVPSSNILTADMDPESIFDPEKFLSERGYVHLEDYLIILPEDMEYIPSERVTVRTDGSKCTRVDSVPEERQQIVDNDRYDDYYYDRMPNGDLFCDGISVSSDLDSCYEFSLHHSECGKCDKYPH